MVRMKEGEGREGPNMIRITEQRDPQCQIIKDSRLQGKKEVLINVILINGFPLIEVSSG